MNWILNQVLANESESRIKGPWSSIYLHINRKLQSVSCWLLNLWWMGNIIGGNYHPDQEDRGISAWYMVSAKEVRSEIITEKSYKSIFIYFYLSNYI